MSNPITPVSYLETQWKRAVAFGWIAFFLEAAAQYGQEIFDAADLMGIASRETNLDPKWLRNAGDNGNGYGLMQADMRSFPVWIKSGKWRDAREGIMMGAKILAHKLADTISCEGRLSIVKTLAGKTYEFTGKKLTPAELRRVAIAAYNSGRWAHYHISKGNPVDRGTTGRNYSQDVLERAAFFRNKLKQIAEPSAPQATITSQVTTTAAQVTSQAASQITDPPASQTTSISLKDFTSKYLKHCPTDKVKNILFIVTGRIVTGVGFVWTLGLPAQILTVVAIIALLAPIVYALYFYRARLWSWIWQIFEGYFGG